MFTYDLLRRLLENSSGCLYKFFYTNLVLIVIPAVYVEGFGGLHGGGMYKYINTVYSSGVSKNNLSETFLRSHVKSCCVNSR